MVNDKGEEVEGPVAFDINVAEEAKKPQEQRLLPVYVCDLGENGTKYILPLAGMGLWGPIWGYVAFDSDCSEGKHLFKDGAFYPIEVVKHGQVPQNSAVDYVDGISGGTITSKGVSAMFGNCLAPYKAWLENTAH